ncbi:MAG TPA: ERAP1-like C-terminal domain-containing protein, partial [Thermoanaerobaculia bacterium]|nr:ERAP1-like C-terminal domain-containing protein [Thermoanaerobaculia bacterium]
FGERARGLGFRGPSGESADRQLLRPELLTLVGQQGGDPALRAEAASLTQKWLADRKAVDPAVSGAVLKLAALDGDAALFERFLSAAKEERDRRERRRLMEALGSFQEPELVDRALAAILADDLDIRETTRIFLGIGETAAEREQLWTWLQKNYATLRTRLPPQLRAELPRFAEDLCELEHRQEVEAFFNARLQELPGAERSLAQTLEQIQLCAAQREAQAASLAEFLARQ